MPDEESDNLIYGYSLQRITVSNGCFGFEPLVWKGTQISLQVPPLTVG